jgi:general stress protein 26
MENTMTEEIESIANQILGKCESVQLASITEDGFPRICEMEKVLAGNIYEIMLITTKRSEKVKHFIKNNKAGIGFSDENNSISLMGHIEIMEIEHIKEQLDSTIEPERWYVKDKNNEYLFCVLCFKMNKARFFINGKLWEFNIDRQINDK